MSTTDDYQRLTPSGMGAIVPWTPGGALGDLAARAKEAALANGCVLVRGVELDEEAFKLLVRSLGDTVDHKFGEGQADLLKLDASRDEGKVVTGRGPLPLHTDGLLVGEQVDLIILYAAEFSDAPGSGETYVSDQLAAWQEMPAQLRHVLDEHEFEYLVKERGYFPTVPVDWYTIPTTRDYGRVKSLNLTTAFPHDVDQRSWEIRVKGMPQVDSDRFFEALDGFLRSERYAYTHRWRVGDLLIIDNQRTLHGRTAIGEGGTRVLFRGQLTLSETAWREDEVPSPVARTVVPENRP
ncbi:TauD/TfdA dioxygenase family protein [Streptomyces sp. NPDC058877]|uniref:TauD/TfdA dioxygenase family protein n=1 Tax=Streptomyces sp. NPDC058877 TaxID=3346665 RepID=UPI0036917335